MSIYIHLFFLSTRFTKIKWFITTKNSFVSETSTTMPERRKIVPGSKLHGTRDDRGDSPSDIESKLGFKDDLDKKKG